MQSGTKAPRLQRYPPLVEATDSFNILTLTPLTTWHHIPEDRTHSHHCENHISHIKGFTQKFQQSKKKKKSSEISLNIIHTVLQCPQ